MNFNPYPNTATMMRVKGILRKANLYQYNISTQNKETPQIFANGTFPFVTVYTLVFLYICTNSQHYMTFHISYVTEKGCR